MTGYAGGDRRIALPTITRALISFATLLSAFAASALAADADRGRQLAAAHCAPCHVVGRDGRGEVAVAPPFETIARKHGFDATAIVRAIAGPHPRMNFAPRPAEAADVAAYIATLK